MKIMELCLSPGRGGMELYMFRAVAALRKEHTVVAVVNRGPGIIRERLDEIGFPYHQLSVSAIPLPLLAAWRLAKLIDRERIEVLHVHWRGDLPLAAFAKGLSREKPRLLYTRQMKISHGKKDPYHNFIYRQVDLFLTITRQLQDDLREKLHPGLHDRIKLLYYGTEPVAPLSRAAKDGLRKEYGIPSDRFVIGMFGQVFEGKGQHLLIEALGGMKREGVRFKALIVGASFEPHYPARLREMVRTLDLEDEVAFVDFVKTPQALMQLCHVAVLASREETFGLVLIEAMSVGTPVIGSDAGGVPEIIDDGKNGFLFKPGDSGSLHDKLCELYRDRRRARALGRAAAGKAAEMFSTKGHYEALVRYMKG
jgi:glycosyltransferase involved in cell wall biosynthesis